MIFRKLVSWALGPSGTMVLDWYVQHNLLVNGLIVVVGLLAIVFPRQRERVVTALRDWWRNAPLALSEEDRESLEQVKARHKAKLHKDRNKREK